MIDHLNLLQQLLKEICLLLQMVFGKMKIQKIGKFPIVGKKKTRIIGLQHYHGI